MDFDKPYNKLIVYLTPYQSFDTMPSQLHIEYWLADTARNYPWFLLMATRYDSVNLSKADLVARDTRTVLHMLKKLPQIVEVEISVHDYIAFLYLSRQIPAHHNTMGQWLMRLHSAMKKSGLKYTINLGKICKYHEFQRFCKEQRRGSKLITPTFENMGLNEKRFMNEETMRRGVMYGR